MYNRKDQDLACGCKYPLQVWREGGGVEWGVLAFVPAPLKVQQTLETAGAPISGHTHGIPEGVKLSPRSVVTSLSRSRIDSIIQNRTAEKLQR